MRLSCRVILLRNPSEKHNDLNVRVCGKIWAQELIRGFDIRGKLAGIFLKYCFMLQGPLVIFQGYFVIIFIMRE